jgi:hypothetical protein
METLEFIYNDKREQNIERYGDTGNSCECCGKPLKEKKYFVNTIEGPDVVEPHITDEEMAANGYESQGIFYLGATCIKKYPKKFRGEL